MGVGALLLTSVLWTAGQAPAAPMFMKSRAINIPITLLPEKAASIRDLLLFVSVDQGRTWSQELRVTPDRKFFPFRAPQDGEYWFSICSIDMQGRRDPPDQNQAPPGLIVVIDTKPPIVKLLSTERVGDQVTVKWHVAEDNPEPSTLKLEYRPAGDETATWIPVAITPGPDGEQPFRPTTTGPIMVRMSFQDKAGNQAQAMNVVPAGPAAPTNNFPHTSPAPAQTLPPALPPVVPVTSNSSTGSALPAPAEPVVPAGPVTLPRVEPAADRILAPGPAMPPIASSSPGVGVPPRDTFTASREAGTPAVASNAPAPAPANSELRSPQLINSTQIKLGYEVTKAGPSGVRRAILYVTDNDGASWQEIGRDESNSGQISATLPGEGTFGFRVVLESAAGLSKGAPVPGDQPEMRVEVDLTTPHVELYAPAPDPNHRDSLILRWTATDKNLANNVIDLEYAEKEDGQWVKIAPNGVPNIGSYSWKLPARMPVRVYLRVVARDLAGNIGEARTAQPQLIDLHKPEGKLTEIKGATMPYRP